MLTLAISFETSITFRVSGVLRIHKVYKYLF